MATAANYVDAVPQHAVPPTVLQDPEVAAARITDFNQLVLHYTSTIYKVALRVLKHEQDAEDVTQNVLLRVFLKCKNFKGQSEFRTWVYRITLSEAINYRRGLNRIPEQPLGEVDFASPAPRPDACLTRITLERLIPVLCEPFRTIFLMRNLEGMEFDDIGRVLGIKRSTARSRDRRAKVALRQKIRPM